MTDTHPRRETPGAADGRPRAPALARSLGLAGLVLGAVAIVLRAVSAFAPRSEELTDRIVFAPVVYLTLVAFAIVGVLVVRREPRNAIGWLFCGLALAYGAGTATSAWSTTR